MQTRRIILGFWLLSIVGCVGHSETNTPSGVVENLIIAWDAGDSQTIDDLMSERGQSHADSYCNGTAIHCLNDNYQGNGKLQTYRTEVVTETAVTAQIRLHTTWSEAEERCQSYDLDKTEAGWQVTFFGRTRKCPDTEG